MKNTKQIKEEGKELYEVGFHIVSSLAEEQVQEVFNSLKSNLAKHTEVTAEKLPSLMRLAYTITKNIDRKNQRFDTAYFGWIKFIASSEEVETIKELFDSNDSVLRSIIVKTVSDAEEAAERLAEEESEEEISEEKEEVSEKKESKKSKEDKSDGKSSGEELDDKIDELVK